MIGAGGHASVIYEILVSQNRNVIAVCAKDLAIDRLFSGLPTLSHDEDVLDFDPEEIELANGIGFMPGSKLRKTKTNYFKKFGYRFCSIIDSTAKVSSFCQIGEGVQILANAVVQTKADVGDYSIINSGAIVEHHSKIGSFSHLAPNSVVCGSVEIAQQVFIGASATIIQGLTVGRNAIVGAGEIIKRDVPAGQCAQNI